MASDTYDKNDLKRRMQGAVSVLKQELGALRTGRASAHLLDPVQVDAYGQSMAAQPARDRQRAGAAHARACRSGTARWCTRSKRRSSPPIWA